MNKTLTQLAERRNRLVNRAAVQRVALARNITPWRLPLALADQSISAWNFIKRHPRWMIGGAVLFASLGPARAGSWVGRGMLAWQMLDTLLGSTRRPEKHTIPPGDSDSSGNSVTG
jgi:hypothetical protein